MVRSTFLFRWHIFLLHHALWSRIRQICRLRIYLCLLNLSRLRAFWRTCWPCVKRTLLSKNTSKSHFCSMSPKKKTFLGKTLTKVSLDWPWDQESTQRHGISRIWFLCKGLSLSQQEPFKLGGPDGKAPSCILTLPLEILTSPNSDWWREDQNWDQQQKIGHASGETGCRYCQRHNGQEGWVQLY